MYPTDSKTISGVLRTLSSVIEAPDDIPAAALMEAAQRIDDLSALSIEMLAMMRHESALPEGCSACAMSARLAALGVEWE